MNRISVRGVTVALIAGGLATSIAGGAAAVTGLRPSKAAASSHSNHGDLSEAESLRLAMVAEQSAAQVHSHWQLPRPRPTAARANRSSYRAPVYSGDPRDIARAMLADYGWSQAQFGCLDALWNKESGWSITETNPSSGAYGIPQALPGWKMASAGADWRTNPATQIRWGLGYIAQRYGTPCGAWDHSQAYNFY